MGFTEYGRCDALMDGLIEIVTDGAFCDWEYTALSGRRAGTSVYEVSIALERAVDPSYTEVVKAACAEEAALIVLLELQRRKAFGVDDDDSVTVTVK